MSYEIILDTGAAPGQPYEAALIPVILPRPGQALLPVITDPAAGHQIVIRSSSRGDGHPISVSCTCLRRRKPYQPPIEEREGRFPAAEALEAWRAWHTQRGVTV